MINNVTGLLMGLCLFSGCTNKAQDIKATEHVPKYKVGSCLVIFVDSKPYMLKVVAVGKYNYTLEHLDGTITTNTIPMDRFDSDSYDMDCDQFERSKE